jgi:hypothetical protein
MTHLRKIGYIIEELESLSSQTENQEAAIFIDEAIERLDDARYELRSESKNYE